MRIKAIISVFLLIGWQGATAQQALYDVTAGNGNGLRFWANDAYKIHMGNSAEYIYGPVSSYSIKMNMSNDAGRGWTWGLSGAAPVAALSNTGSMQIAGGFIARGLALSRYGSTLAGDPNPYTIYTFDNESHDLLLYGNGGTGILHFRMYDGDLKLGSDATPNTILRNNGSALFGGKLEIKAPYSGSQMIINTTSANAELRFSDNDVAKGYVWFAKSDNMMAFGIGSASNSMYINSSGNFGIGVKPATNAKFEVAGPGSGSGPTIKASGGGDVLLNTGGTLFFDGNYSYASGNYIRPVSANTQGFFTSGAERLRISSSGNVGIGTSSPNEMLTVNGKIYGKEVKVDLAVPGPDYVFEENYNLPSLTEIKAYIDAHKHLPEVPSARQLAEEGIKLGEMNMILLKKVEELTLYLIEQQKRLDAQQKEIQSLKERKN